MCALRLALMNKRKTKRSTRGSSNSSISTSATTDDDVHLNPEYDNEINIFFYAAAANAFDHSPTIREYFCHDPSRISPKNKSLWPLRYQAYIQYGV
jgi:hypothetical protein